MEYTGTYSQRLAYSLNLRQAKFSILNPSQSSSFAKTLKNSSKTDSQDARLLSLYGQKMEPTATILPDEKLELFKDILLELVADYEKNYLKNVRCQPNHPMLHRNLIVK